MRRIVFVTKVSRTFVVVGLLALSVKVGTLHAAPVPADKLTAFAIPRMSSPPKIDGTIDPAEWREAVAISGVAEQGGNALFPRPTTFFLAWDADHLYLACRAWVMPGYKPMPFGREPGAVSAGDDGLELHFQPRGQNVPKGQTTESSFKFFVNCMGFDGDIVRVSVGQLFRTWHPKFRTAARTTAPGTAPKGGSWLEIEWAGTIQDFELAGPNRAGDVWKLMLGFNHMPMWTQARVPCNSGYFDPAGYCVGTLAEGVPGVQVLMEALPGPCDGAAAVTFRAYNPAAQPVQLDVLAQYADGQTDLVKRASSLTVAPTQTAEFKVNEALPRAPKDGTIYYRVMQGSTELFRYFTYFQVGYPESYMKFTPPKEAFPFSATFNPIRANFQIQGDTYFLKQPEAAKALRYQVVKEGSNKPVFAGLLTNRVTAYFKDFITLPPLAEGKYTVEASLEMADGTTVGPERATFEKLNEAKMFAAWWQKGLGHLERVIPPFTPMTRDGATVKVWGRAYKLGPVGLPQEIVSQGKTISAAPARIVAVIDGKEQVISLKDAPSFTETKDWRVSFTGKTEGAGLVFRSQGWIEQDGLARMELTYAPAGKVPVRIDGLRIEWPLDARQAECLLCVGPGGNFSSRTTVVLPAKQGRLWSTLDLGKEASGMTVGSFFPEVWLGNEQRGLLWWGDSDRGWVPEDDVPAHEVWREGQTVVLRNNLIGKPFTLDGPRTVAFSIMASPFKPLPKGWRATMLSWDGTFHNYKDFKYRVLPDGKIVNGWNWLTPPSTDPAEWSALWAEYKQKADAKVRQSQPFDPCSARNGDFVHTSVPLRGYGFKSPDERVIRYFAPEWGDAESYPESNIDYYLYLIDRAIREGGIRTIYWDVNYPTPQATLQNEVGYRLPDGRVQPAYVGFNVRRFLMRCYALMLDRGLIPGAQVSHVTNAYVLPDWPWLDAVLEGEFHMLTDDSTMDWVDGYPVDRMRAMSNAGNFGIPINWMNHIMIKEPTRARRVQRGQIDYIRLFDAWNGRPATAPLDWGMNDERTEFVPFWRNPYVQGADKDVFVSMWRLPDRVLLEVFNYDGQQTKDAVVKIDLDALGLTPKLPWQEFIGVRVLDDYQEGEPSFDFYSRTLTVRGLQAHTGRLIGIRRY